MDRKRGGFANEDTSGRMSLSKGFTQGGSNADVVLVDAYVKNLTGINWEDAYASIVNDAENEPIDWSVEGRGGLMSWKNFDYIPYLDYDYLVGHTRQCIA